MIYKTLRVDKLYLALNKGGNYFSSCSISSDFQS